MMSKPRREVVGTRRDCAGLAGQDTLFGEGTGVSTRPQWLAGCRPLGS